MRFQEAIALVDADRHEKADAICVELLAGAPRDASVIFLRGLIAFRLGNTTRAILWLREAIALDPDNPSFHGTLGAILIERGARSDAIAALERAVALQPDDMESLRHLARQYGLAGRGADAVEAWRPVAATTADLLALGDALEVVQALDAALTVYRQAVSRTPDSVAVQNHLGACQQKLRLLGDAILAYGTSIGLQPDNNPAVLGLFAAKQMACDWDDFAQWGASTDALTQASIAAGTPSAEDPFTHITRSDDQARNFALARQWSAAVSERVAGWDLRFDHRRRGCGPLRIGYL